MKEAVVIGYSGHAYVVIDMLISIGYSMKGYCEAVKKVDNPFDIPYLGREDRDEVFQSIKGHDIFIAIGDNKVRKRVAEYLFSLNAKLPNLVHHSAQVSPRVSVGYSSVIMPGVVINAMAQLGNGVICNSSSIIEHECKIADYVHIAPGAVLVGNVQVGSGSFIGANSVIKQGVKIGENVVVGAGAVVTKDIDSGKTFIGNPARNLNR